MEFSELGLDDDLLDGIWSMGYREATPIQQQAIPLALAGKDLIACAQTGTGKTAAFLLPVINKIITTKAKNDKSMRALIIVPTRELALQIDQQLQGMAYFTPVTSFPVYGGSDGSGFDQQKVAMTTGTEVIIATPGKLLSHLNLGYVPTDGLEFLILDEADRMMDMGFSEDIARIVEKLPKDRQTLMFSATMPADIRDMAKKTLKPDPGEISIALSKPAEGVDQQAYVVYDGQKKDLILDLLNNSDATSVLVFAGTKRMTREVAQLLKRKGISAKALSSDLEQNEREEVLLSFRNRNLRVLVGTNVVSRGIDVEDIDIVINYDVPGDPEDYVHRVGRTARAASKGTAITLVNDHEMRNFGRIEELIGYPVKKMPVPEKLGKGPAYDPNAKVASRGRTGGRSGGGGNRKGGGRPSGSSGQNRGPRKGAQGSGKRPSGQGSGQ